MILNPETLAVIEPRVDAASAVVERCPMDITEAMTREYSNRCVLSENKVSTELRTIAKMTYAKTGRVYFVKTPASSFSIVRKLGGSRASSASHSSSMRGTKGAKSGVFSVGSMGFGPERWPALSGRGPMVGLKGVIYEVGKLLRRDFFRLSEPWILIP